MTSTMENEVVLFNGVVYEKTGEEIKGALLVDQKKHATGGYQTVLVDGESAMVTQEAGEYDPDEEDDVTAEGHKYVVLNGQVYELTYDDPTDVPDDVVRVEAVYTTRLRRQTPVVEQKKVAIPRLPNTGAGATTGVDQALQAVRGTYFDNLLNGPRTGIKLEAVLPLGFDLPTHVRNRMTLVKPVYKKPKACGHGDFVKCACKKSRDRWNVPEHHEHLFVLIKAATKFLGRKPELRDFSAITEAMHRSFPGPDNAFPVRGSCALHTFACKINTANGNRFVALVADALA